MGTPRWEGSCGKPQGARGEVSPLGFLKISMQPPPRRPGPQPATQFASQSHPVAQACRASKQCGAKSRVLGDPFSHVPPRHCAAPKVASLHRGARGASMWGCAWCLGAAWITRKGLGGCRDGSSSVTMAARSREGKETRRREKVRVATPVAGMSSAEVKGAGAKHGAGRAASTCP